MNKNRGAFKCVWPAAVTLVLLCIGPTAARAVLPHRDHSQMTKAWNDFNKCTAYTRKNFYTLAAETLENRLKNNQGLSPKDVQELQADINSVRTAVNTGQIIDADPKAPRRWMRMWLTRDDLKRIYEADRQNKQNIMKACADIFARERFGGLSGQRASGEPAR